MAWPSFKYNYRVFSQRHHSKTHTAVTHNTYHGSAVSMCQQAKPVRITTMEPVPWYRVVMDFMILILDSVRVGQFTKKNRSESFSSVSGSGESWNARFSAESVRLSSSLVLKRSHKRSSINTQHYYIKLNSFQLRSAQHSEQSASEWESSLGE